MPESTMREKGDLPGQEERERIDIHVCYRFGAGYTHTLSCKLNFPSDSGSQEWLAIHYANKGTGKRDIKAMKGEISSTPSLDMN